MNGFDFYLYKLRKYFRMIGYLLRFKIGFPDWLNNNQAMDNDGLVGSE